MKKHAQAILQFTGYPLEPIVAYQIKKSYQAQPPVSFYNVPSFTGPLQTKGFIYKTDDLDERWYRDYE